MSCKLLLNLVDCIRQRSEGDSTTARDLLITMLRVFTLKFHTIAKMQLPLIIQKWKSLKPDPLPLAITSGIPQQPGIQTPSTPQSINIPNTPTTATSTDANSREILGLVSLIMYVHCSYLMLIYHYRK